MKLLYSIMTSQELASNWRTDRWNQWSNWRCRISNNALSRVRFIFKYYLIYLILFYIIILLIITGFEDWHIGVEEVGCSDQQVSAELRGRQRWVSGILKYLYSISFTLFTKEIQVRIIEPYFIYKIYIIISQFKIT